MSLPDVVISRTNGQLGRVQPTKDNVFAFLISGTAVAGKIALSEPKLINGTSAIADLGLTAANNALAIDVIQKFYALAGEGTEMYIILYSDATLLADVCDKTTGVVKTLLDFGEGRVRGLFVAKKLPAGYTPTISTGLDNDIWNAVTKLQDVCVTYGAANEPLFAVLPGFGFTKAALAALKDLTTDTKNQVSILLAADNSTGTPAIATLAGWLARLPVHQNIGRVAYGSVADAGWLIDGTPIKEVRTSWGILHDRRYIFFRTIKGKSGVFFNDDPTACSVADDYSSISWNRVINKAHVLAYEALVEHLNDDVDTDPTTGGISPTLASDWEGEVERAIESEMLRPGEISAVKCTIDPSQVNLTGDQVKAEVEIVRKGQAKKISVEIGYTSIIN